MTALLAALQGGLLTVQIHRDVRPVEVALDVVLDRTGSLTGGPVTEGGQEPVAGLRRQPLRGQTKESKPAPDILQAAIDQAGVDPRRGLRR